MRRGRGCRRRVRPFARSTIGGRRAVFIDKDGTLVENVPYNVDPTLLRFTPGAVDGLRLLARHGFLLVVVTNQPGVALGRFRLPELTRLQQALSDRLAADGIALAGFRYCPHAPATASDPACTCRKPAPGMLLAAAREHRLDLTRSFMVGDILDDVEAGQRAGCRTVLLDVGNESEWRDSTRRRPHHRAANLLEAARWIVGQALRQSVPLPRKRRPDGRR